MRSGSGKTSSSSAKQFRRVALPHVGSVEKEQPVCIGGSMAPVTGEVDRKRLATQRVTKEARVSPSSEVGLPLAAEGTHRWERPAGALGWREGASHRCPLLVSSSPRSEVTRSDRDYASPVS